MASLMLAAILVCLIPTSTAYDFYVGGGAGWVENPKESYNNWASRMRFQVNDKIVFKFNKTGDSVLVVKKEDYDSCNVNNPIQKLQGGDSASFQFTRSGPFYFISGAQDRCTKGQKMIVAVMAVRGKKPLPPPPAAAPTPSLQPPTSSPSTSPSPSPSSMTAPTPSPSASPTAAPTPSPSSGGASPSPSTAVSPPAETPSSGNGGGGPAGNEPAASPTSAPPAKSSSSALTGSRVTIGTVALVLAHAFLG